MIQHKSAYLAKNYMMRVYTWSAERRGLAKRERGGDGDKKDAFPDRESNPDLIGESDVY